MKKNFIKNILFITIMLLIAIMTFVFAGTIENVDGYQMYKLADGTYAKDTWCFVDFNGDTISECYRFDENGHIIKNYVSEDGRETNDKGQLVENGFVVEKLSSGRVRYGEGVPFVNNANEKAYLHNAPTDNSSYPTETYINKGIIKTTEISDDFIGPRVPQESNKIIYAGEAGVSAIGTTTNSASVVNNKSGFAVGKNIKNFIDRKVNCKIEADDVIIYGGTIWDDCIELRGTNSRVSFKLKNNNYITFEVAEEPHATDEKDKNLRLEVYVDGELFETMDEFVEGEPQTFESELFDNKIVELKVVSDISTSRRVYIHNGRFKRTSKNIGF